MAETPGTDRDEAREARARDADHSNGVEHTNTDPAKTADCGTGL